MAEERRDTNTGGGDYAEKHIDKRQGNFGDTIHNLNLAVETINYLGKSKPSAVPHRLLFLNSNYVPRPGKERELLAKLTDPQGPRLLLLHGPSGAGKSSLVANVLHRDSRTVFEGGVLAASLRNSSLNEILFLFIRLLDPSQHLTDRDNTVLRDVLWQQLIHLEKPLLLVFDDVDSEQQLTKLLPSDQSNYGLCRVLIISTAEFAITQALVVSDRMYLTGFEMSEAEMFFTKTIGADRVTHYHEQIHAICEHFEYNPLKLKSVARKLTRHELSPREYLSRIDSLGENLKPDDIIPPSLKQALEDLSLSQQELFALTSAFGSGDWTEAMLAAVALRPITEVLNDLHELVEYGLVNRRSNGRYHLNAIVDTLAYQRFMHFDPQRQQTTYMLLSRYCLDLAQDAEADILSQPTTGVVADTQSNQNRIRFVEMFRTMLLHEQSHFQKALDWAASQQRWKLLRRFSFLSSMELLSYLVANGGEIQLSMCMATLVEPIIWPSGEDLLFDYQSLITAGEFHYQQHNTSIAATEPSYQNVKKSQCELIWEITAGTIVDGVIRSARLLYSRWLGVRAPHLICRDVDIVGGKFLGCDFSNSVWTGCDARHVDFNGTMFRHALIYSAELHGADLQHANFAYSVLENVKLRNAKLQMADFTGAWLRHVDLRNADLRGATFAYAKLENIDFRGCDLQGVDWTGADGIKSDNVRFDEGQDTAIHVLVATTENPPTNKQRRRPANVNDVISAFDLSERDLRALNFDGRLLARPKDLDNFKEPAIPLQNSDLRSATFRRANLQGCSIRFSDLRDIDLCEADLRNTDLRNADLRGALLTRASLEHARIDRAILRAARLHRAKLQGASCIETSFRGADITGTDLRQAELARADLSNVTARAAHFDGAKLNQVLLIDANLEGSHFQDTTLYGAICIRTNFSKTNLSDEQLAQAERLSGATLPDSRIPAVIDANGATESEVPLPSFLRFSEWLDKFSKLNLQGKDLFGACLCGTFSKATFTDIDLTHARLHGIFSKTKFVRVTLVRAHLSGIFSKVKFQDVCCTETSFVGASLVNCDLTETQELFETQLRQAHRLRGTIMPDGTHYAGQFELAGDIEDAVRNGIDPHNSAAMLCDFYNITDT